jgi:hypothetical protein
MLKAAVRILAEPRSVRISSRFVLEPKMPMLIVYVLVSVTDSPLDTLHVVAFWQTPTWKGTSRPYVASRVCSQ